MESDLIYFDDGTEELNQAEFTGLVQDNGFHFTIYGTRAGQGNLLTSRLECVQAGCMCIVEQFDLYTAQDNQNVAATYVDIVPTFQEVGMAVVG